jgi:hypothetical protein
VHWAPLSFILLRTVEYLSKRNSRWKIKMSSVTWFKKKKVKTHNVHSLIERTCPLCPQSLRCCCC